MGLFLDLFLQWVSDVVMAAMHKEIGTAGCGVVAALIILALGTFAALIWS